MKRLECLDGLRGVLAVYVMISHMAPFAAMPAWVGRPFSHGQAAVDVFFILSGLVIVGSLHGFGHRARPFLIARLARIHPLFLAVLALSFAAHAVPSALPAMTWLDPEGLAYRMWAGGWPSHWPADLAAHLTMTHGLFPNGAWPHVWISLLGPAWSLSTEWQFYVLALVIGGWLARSGRSDALAWVFLGIGVLGLAWTMLVPWEWGFSRAFIGNKAALFALGVMSWTVVGGADRRAPVRYGVMLAAVLALCWCQGGIGKLAAPLVWTLCLLAQCEAWRPLEPLGLALRSRALQWLGVMSYGIYLVNEPVHRLLGAALVRLTGPDAVLFTLLWLPLAFLLPILAAAWLHHVVEMPCQRWGRALLRGSGGVRIPS